MDFILANLKKKSNIFKKIILVHLAIVIICLIIILMYPMTFISVLSAIIGSLLATNIPLLCYNKSIIDNVIKSNLENE